MATEQLPPRRPRGRPRDTGDKLCPRCERATTRLESLSPGHVFCRSCIETALHTHGTCPGCTTDTLLPGLDSEGQSICSDCAGYTRNFTCSRCSKERAPYRRGLCEWCSLADDLDSVLQPSAFSPESAFGSALRSHLLEAARPRSIVRWLQNAQVRDLLSGLARGDVDATHESLDQLPQNASLAHIRALLIDRGQLPSRDEALARFTAWIPMKIDTVRAPESRDALRRFATWHHLRRVRMSAEKDRGATSAAHNAKQEITVAANFLNWLGDRGTALSSCGQEHIDLWVSNGPTTRYTVRNFLTYTAASQLSRSLVVPRRTVKSIRRVDKLERIEMIRRILDDRSHPTSHRLPALLLLIFGQPITRIVSMTIDDFNLADTGAQIRFSDDWIELPPAIAKLVADHLENRAPTMTRAVDQSHYVFPGSRPGQHIHRDSLKTALNRLGIDLLGTRNTTLDELVAAMPSPLVADSLGFSYSALAQHESFQGLRFERYVAGRYSD